MAGIILDSRKIMVYEDLKYLVDFTGLPEDYTDTLWSGMLMNNGLYEEFLYYIDNRALKDEFSYRGYSLTDIYVYIITEDNIFNDIGKNTEFSNKDKMVLKTFMGMLELIKNPDEYIKRLESGRGMDKL